MENFMNRLAEKISAQDIIRANSQAEAKETERIKQEAEQYKAQLEELKRATAEYKTSLEEMRNDVQEYKGRLDKNDEKIHDVGVQVYRNVQAVVDKGYEKTESDLKELSAKLEAIQVAVETKNNSLMPIAIITMLLVLTDLVFNILRFLGII
ncbi:hypothetical protein [Butyrivibrio sp. YAB3001]|uniref:hypothetical protein n=1 Tax=Butyrivibrio sp. YAB3001 TaxID=1520812 RepID=UPI0008F6789B|nr:hypothetical protein [Butyrivibrio sp. YAB3001]SFC78263.1 hypothetical protein SAMN02910398_03145 [Butyrivibrio sp. YAB3001]